MITLQNITVKFDDKLVLDNLSTSFEVGKRYAIMGESGCGKSTILNVISGLIKPQTGAIDTKLKSQRISYAFQEPRLYDWLTVLDNVTLVSELPKKESKEKANEILSNLGLENSISLYPAELSGGMKQRVSIARAIMYAPDVLLIDEPFRALDDETRQKVAKYLFEIMNGKTVIMVTHDEKDTVYCDYVAKITKTPITSLTW